MAAVRTEFLYRMALEVAPPLDLGQTPHGNRLIYGFRGGRFEGPRLRGEVLTTGGDWSIARSDGVAEPDIRRTFRTDDGHLIYAQYKGLLHGSTAVMERVGRGEAVGPDEIYFRTTPYFETGSEKYGWLNRVIAIGIGEITATGPLLAVHQIL